MNALRTTLLLSVLAAGALFAASAIDARAQDRAVSSGSVIPPLPAREWVTTESDEPAEEEWTAAAVLRTVSLAPRRGFWSVKRKVECVEKTVREWMRITCTPDHSDKRDDTFIGVIWALGGDVSTVKADIPHASTLENYKAAPQNIIEQSTRLMGASATITFRVKRGSAMLLDLDTIRWVDDYNGPTVVVQPGVLVDVSWAHGEPAPYVSYE